MSMTFIDLFSGCGGLSYGLVQSGFTPVLAADIDPLCRDTYVANHPLDESTFFLGDVNELNRRPGSFWRQWEDVDLVCGGPPCQGFSTANRQRVIDDPRNRLYKAYLYFLGKTRPKVFLMENVKGMAGKIDEIMDDFARDTGGGYNVAYALLNARSFGVPQHRERLFIIGCRTGGRAETVFDGIRRESAPSFTLRDAIGDLPELKPKRIRNRPNLENRDCGFARRPYAYEQTPFVRFVNDGRVVTSLFNHKNRYNNDRDIEIFTRLPQGGNSLHASIADIMPYGRRNHIFKDKYFRLRYDELCRTITSHMKYDCNMYIHPTQPRGLSPREAARVQTFPDDFVFKGPQNGWYRQIGNAVPVKLAEAVGRHIARCVR